jgi:hypothetical protein
MFVKEDCEGKIDIKGESGLLWNAKTIILKPNENELEITRKDKNNEPYRLYL